MSLKNKKIKELLALMESRMAFKALRINEIFLMSGFFLIGGIFAISRIDYWILRDLFFYFIFCFVIIFSIYTFNAYCGADKDVYNERLKDLKLLNKNSYLIISLIAFLISVIICLFINIKLYICLFIIYLLWASYSIPNIGFKNVPFIATFLHFLSEIIQFNMVYSLFEPVSKRSILISVYFALIFSGGHLYHEVIDYESDSKASVKTLALRLGINNAEILAIASFAISSIYWVILYSYDFISFFEYITFLAAFCIQFVSFLYFFNKLKINKNYRIYNQIIYRTVYLLAGLGIIISRI
jgi:lycopene elongase/hydratase (dihydrobisanhydrobacterioruberin-forming)